MKLDEVTAEKIIENFKTINSSITFISFYYGDVINQINNINLKFDSKILSNEFQYDIILKGLEHTNKIFHIKNAYKHYYKNVLGKLKKSLYNKLIIFKTEEGNIFGAFKSFQEGIKDDKGFVFSVTNNTINFTNLNGYSLLSAYGDIDVKNNFYLSFKNGKYGKCKIFNKSLDIGEEELYINDVEIYEMSSLIK